MHAQHQNSSAQLEAIELYKTAVVTRFSGREIYKAQKSIPATNIDSEFACSGHCATEAVKAAMQHLGPYQHLQPQQHAVFS
jgi:hypothetical protein